MSAGKLIISVKIDRFAFHLGLANYAAAVVARALLLSNYTGARAWLRCARKNIALAADEIAAPSADAEPSKDADGFLPRARWERDPLAAEARAREARALRAQRSADRAVGTTRTASASRCASALALRENEHGRGDEIGGWDGMGSRA